MSEKPRSRELADQYPFGAKEVCREVGISHRQLDYWVLIGVVRPHLERHGAKLFRRFSQQNLIVLRQIKQLTDEGVVVSRAAERVRRDMGAGPSPDAGTAGLDAGPTAIEPNGDRADDDQAGHGG